MHTVASRYSRQARVYHWLTFALVLVVYATINLRKAFERGSDERMLAVESHFLFGMAVLLVVIPRVLHRLRQVAPPVVPALPPVLRWVGRGTHLLLYAFLIVQPLLGIAARLAEGKGIGLPFTERVIPSFFGAAPAFAEWAEGLHLWLGEAFYWVIGAHIAAALWHWLVRRDNALQRML